MWSFWATEVKLVYLRFIGTTTDIKPWGAPGECPLAGGPYVITPMPAFLGTTIYIKPYVPLRADALPRHYKNSHSHAVLCASLHARSC